MVWALQAPFTESPFSCTQCTELSKDLGFSQVFLCSSWFFAKKDKKAQGWGVGSEWLLTKSTPSNMGLVIIAGVQLLLKKFGYFT